MSIFYLQEALSGIKTHEYVDDIKAVVCESSLTNPSNQRTQSLKKINRQITYQTNDLVIGMLMYETG